jgi:hypothetical protein
VSGWRTIQSWAAKVACAQHEGGEVLPVHAFLEYHDIPCPNCGVPLKCVYEPEPCYITFDWGYCATRYVADAVYQVGDPIYWRPSRDGVVRAWASFGSGCSFNHGDPALSSVIVTDFGTDTAQFPLKCQVCGECIGGAALHIRDNVIVSAWAFLPGQLKPGVPAVYHAPDGGGGMVEVPAAEAEPWQVINVYVEQEDGTWKPMPEWEFRLMDHFEQ